MRWLHWTSHSTAGWLLMLPAFVLLSVLPVSGADRSFDYCTEDAISALAIPGGGRGACAQIGGTSRTLTQFTEDGMLFVQVDEPQSFADAEFRFTGDAARLLYCPAALLDRDTGAPTMECLSAPGVPGPRALVGSGWIQANASFGGAGSASCPSSIHVRGIVNTRGGEAFEIQSSLVRFRDPSGRSSCQTVQEQIATKYLGEASSLTFADFSQFAVPDGTVPGGGPLAGMDRHTMELLEATARLDDRQFGTLVQLSKLEPSDWQILAQMLESQPAGTKPGKGATVVSKVNLTTEPDRQNVNLQDVKNAVDSVKRDTVLLTRIPNRSGGLSHARSVLARADFDLWVLRTQVLQLVNSLPTTGNAPPGLVSRAQDIIAEIQGIDRQALVEFVGTVKDGFDGTFQFISSIRSGYQQFNPNNCGTPSPCADFKADLLAFLQETEDARTLLTDRFKDMLPNGIPAQLIQFDGTPIQKVLNVVPPFALYVLHQTLDRFLPNWRNIPGMITTRIPDFSSALQSASVRSDKVLLSAVPSNRAALSFKTRLCAVVFGVPDLDKDLKKLELIGKLAGKLWDNISEDACPSDLDISAAAVAGAGGGGGATLAPHPCKVTAGTIANIIERFGDIVEKIMKFVDDCESEANRLLRLESSIAQCAPLVGFQLPQITPHGTGAIAAIGGHLDSLFEVVELRAWQMNRLGLSTSDPKFNLQNAQNELTAGQFAQAYDSLCAAYAQLQSNMSRTKRGK